MSSQPGRTLSVVVPTFNEQHNVPLFYDGLCVALAGIDWEVIFVDDDSPDGTHAIAKRIAARDDRVRCLRRVNRRGLAGACIEGILASSAPYVAVMDADLQHDEKTLPAMLEAAQGGATVVIASRYMEGGGEDFTPGRRFISHMGTRLTRMIMRQEISDPMSGFFLLRRDDFEKVAPSLSESGFKILFDVLSRMGNDARCVDIPYHFRQRLHGESKLDVTVIASAVELLLCNIFGNVLPTRFFLLCAVGSISLVIHLTVLRVILEFFPHYFTVAHAAAACIAMTNNFVLNNSFTYSDRRLKGWPLLPGRLSFYAVCSFGSLTNIAFGVIVYTYWPLWWVAATAGVAMGAVWNHAISSAFVWNRQ